MSMSTASTTNSTTALPRSSRALRGARARRAASLGLQERPADDVEPVVGAEQPEHRHGCHDADLDDPHARRPPSRGW